MHLIADSGSTKTNWTILDKNMVLSRCTTRGFNPHYLTTQEIISGLTKALIPQLGDNKNTVERIWFYGAGCSGGEGNEKIHSALVTCFPGTACHVHSDLLAAARSLCEHKPGVACILGTGSNSCLFDGKEIIEHIPPLGFIFGDDGSGAELGRLLVKAYFQKRISNETMLKFEHEFSPERNAILKLVYATPTPNRYLAGFAKFFSENIDDKNLRGMAENCFLEFFMNSVFKYSGYKEQPIHFTGSIAFYFQDFLINIMDSFGLKKGKITKDPMEGLIEFHINADI